MAENRWINVGPKARTRLKRSHIESQAFMFQGVEVARVSRNHHGNWWWLVDAPQYSVPYESTLDAYPGIPTMGEAQKAAFDYFKKHMRLKGS